MSDKSSGLLGWISSRPCGWWCTGQHHFAAMLLCPWPAATWRPWTNARLHTQNQVTKKQVHQTYACHFTLAGKFCKSNCEPRVFTLRCSAAHQSLMPTTVMHPDANLNQRNKSLHQSHAFRVQLVNQFGACNCCYNYK